MLNYQELRKESLRLGKEIKSIKMQLRNLPEGKLVFSHTGKYCKWYLSDGKNKTYIPKKDRALAQALAKKKYLSLRLTDVTTIKDNIDHCLKYQNLDMAIAEKLLTETSEYQNLLSPLFKLKTKDLEEWKQADYEKNQKYPEHLIYTSISGNVLRSKSEVLIDMLLYTNKIPYHYEELIHLGDIIVAPDFTIKHPVTGEMFYWEHLGRMDDPGYVKNACEKIGMYSLHGIVPSVNLILTFETQEHPLSPHVVIKL